jgi:hypothetical protein
MENKKNKIELSYNSQISIDHKSGIILTNSVYTTTHRPLSTKTKYKKPNTKHLKQTKSTKNNLKKNNDSTFICEKFFKKFQRAG